MQSSQSKFTDFFFKKQYSVIVFLKNSSRCASMPGHAYAALSRSRRAAARARRSARARTPYGRTRSRGSKLDLSPQGIL
jgi:hypothetical protein